jgi:hypothetical protein
VGRTIIVLLIRLAVGVALPIRVTIPGHAAAAGRYAAFAGTYFLHDARIIILPNGWGLFSYGDTQVTCPKCIGSCRLFGYIGTAGKPGPHASFQLDAIQGNAAYGYVLTDSQYAFVGLAMRIVRQSTLPSILLSLPDSTWPGCRNVDPATYKQQCGA